MTLQFTVAIPTYNGAARLPFLLEGLRSQINTAHIAWEVIVVDNNSTDDTAQVVRSFQKNWLATVPLKYAFEPRQGVAYARQRAVEEAKGTFIGFLDDDNVPFPDWVARAYQFGQENPQAGAFGGQIHGDFEVPPPAELKAVQNYLVIRKYASEPRLFDPERLRLPPGAGLVVRRRAWLMSVPRCLVLTQRGGNDYEISLRMYSKGWEIWFNPAMQITHRIPASRLRKNHLVPLAHLYGLCTCELLLITAKPSQRPVILIRSFLGSLRRVVRHLFRYRMRAITDLSPACEMAFFVGNLISPFHYLRRRIMYYLH